MRTIGAQEQLHFSREGHVCTRALLQGGDIDELREALAATMAESREEAKLHAVMMNEADDDGEGAPPFLQHFHPWRRSADVARFAKLPTLARTAALLLGVDRVRLYQDCAFEKRPGDEATNWHSDLKMAPFDTNSFVTAWIPLQDVPEPEDGGTGLCYVSRSHTDFALSYFYGDKLRGEAAAEFDLSERYEDAIVDHGAVCVGDVCWHHGWTLHSAAPNDLETARIAYTVSFVADGVRTLSEEALRCVDNEDAPSYEAWLKDVGYGERVEHRDVPLLGT